MKERGRATAKRISADVDGFTPLFDSLVDQLGLITAAVFGRVWRYCQMEDGVCKASMQTIGEGIGLNMRTAIRHVDVLVAAGYLKDMTPELRNKPHVYADTGKIKMRLVLESAMTESHTAMTESHSRYDRESHPAMTESHLKRVQETLKETFQEREEGGASRAAASAPDMPIPDALKNQPAPPRKARAPKLSPANITASDDPRIAAYLEHLKDEITPTNAVMICERVSLDQLDAWRETMREWAYGNGDASWNPTNFAGMFERYERKLTSRRAKASGHQPSQPKAQPQPQQFGIGGELYRAAVAAGFDLSELQAQEASIGN